MLVFSHKFKSYRISGQIFALIASFLSNRQLRVALDGKSSLEYPLNAGVPQGSILDPILFLLYIRPCIVLRSFIVTRHIFVFLPLAGSKTSKFSLF